MVNRLNPHHSHRFLIWMDVVARVEMEDWLLEEFGKGEFMTRWSFGTSEEKVHSISQLYFDHLRHGRSEYCITFRDQKDAMYFKLRWG